MKFATAYAPLGLTMLALIAGAWYMHARLESGGASATPTLVTIPDMPTKLSLTSLAFSDGSRLPASLTCDSDHPTNPPLAIAGVPAGTKSLALIVDDPDVPKILVPSGVFDHWILFDIPATTTEIAAGASPGIPGNNSAGEAGFYPPCPPKQYEPSEHRYVFTLYALDIVLGLSMGTDKATLLAAIQGHIIAQATLVGRYQRK